MDRHCIDRGKTLVEAMRQINGLGHEPLVLFVTDGDGRVTGSLTDGDIRRAIAGGTPVDGPVTEAAKRDFEYIEEATGKSDVEKIRRLRQRRIKLIPVLDRERRLKEIINLDETKNRLPVDAVVMAGGKGERLRPLTDTTPKPLLKIGDKAIIDHNIDRLIDYGIRDINVTVNYLHEQIERHFEEPVRGVRVRTVREPRFLGTIGSAKLAGPFSHDTILVMNSDLFTNIDLENFYLHFAENGADMSVAAVPYNVSIPFGILELEGRNVQALVEKPHLDFYINGGIYLLRRSVLEEIPDGERFDATDLIGRLLVAGRRVIRYPLNGTWIDIGTLPEYQKAQELFSHM